MATRHLLSGFASDDQLASLMPVANAAHYNVQAAFDGGATRHLKGVTSIVWTLGTISEHCIMFSKQTGCSVSNLQSAKEISFAGTGSNLQKSLLRALL